MRLKSREHQIPNGFRFRQEELKWDSLASIGPHPSFNRLVDAVIGIRRGNKWLAEQKGWALDRESVSAEVEAYQVKLCIDNGWGKYIEGGELLPKPVARQNALSRVAAGERTLHDWIGEGGKPVSKDLAETRAAICVGCPKNEGGDWTRFFTVPASSLIRRWLSAKSDMNLATSHDDKLGVCAGCNCPMKLKVWTPLVFIHQNMPQDVRNDLDPRCWILKES